MRVIISEETTVGEVQYDFRSFFPFLKLDFYRLRRSDPTLPVRKHLADSTTLRAAGLKASGILDLSNDMKVLELENAFLNDFGLDVQVSRKSGMLWLEATMTENWSLMKQNEHGREISLSPAEVSPYSSDDVTL